MEFFKNKDMDDANMLAKALLDDTPRVYDEIPRILGLGEQDTTNAVQVSSGLWNDSGLSEWAQDPARTWLVGGGKFLWELVRSPTSDVSLLQQRQRAIKALPLSSTVKLLERARDCEKDVLWLFTLPEMSEAYPLNLLFPSMPIARLINHMPAALSAFQFYRSTILPWTSIAFPITTFIGPWWYVRRTLKINISLKRYCMLVYSAMCMGLAPTKDNIRANASKYFSMFIYIFFYLYGIVQGFQSSTMLRNMQSTLTTKMTRIRTFVESAHAILAKVPEECITAFDATCSTGISLHIPAGMSGLYRLMKDPASQLKLKMLCRAMWAVDACAAARKLIKTRQCCLSSFTDTNTIMYDMGHVTLPSTQVKNPVSLEKSLIITGPNAAGKTTYVRSLLTNIILSQSMGIACATRAHVVPIHALGTFMRISDELGTSSLFEAEVKRCAELIEQAEAVAAAGHRAMYFLDEPMHSTPPIEGSATSKAVIEYIGKIPGVRVLVTTHYHDLTSMSPSLFFNVSMDAVAIDVAVTSHAATQYTFPYRIQRGPSYKCIALELLEKNKLPIAIVQEAIRIKNSTMLASSTA